MIFENIKINTPWLNCSLRDKLKNENLPNNPNNLELNFQEDSKFRREIDFLSKNIDKKVLIKAKKLTQKIIFEFIFIVINKDKQIFN